MTGHLGSFPSNRRCLGYTLQPISPFVEKQQTRVDLPADQAEFFGELTLLPRSASLGSFKRAARGAAPAAVWVAGRISVFGSGTRLPPT